MKTNYFSLLLANAIWAIAVFGLIPVATAQTFTNLHDFSSAPGDGGIPNGGIILSGSKLYGTTAGGSSGYGTVFTINRDGTGFTLLHDFTSTGGVIPRAGVILSGNALYGTTTVGGSNDSGTVFSVQTNGTGFNVLHHFATASPTPTGLYTNSEGFSPAGRFILAGDTFYGTAYRGGSSDNGTVFAIRTNGTGFTNLHSFTATSGATATNSEGARPTGGLILAGNTLYGLARWGGSSGSGTVFKINTNGTGFTNLHSFTAPSGSNQANSDGADPSGELISSGNTLYGTAAQGGSAGSGTLFAVNTDGTGFTNLHHFTTVPPIPGPYTNSGGAVPWGGLTLSGGKLFGATISGGSQGSGTLFAINLSGTGFATLLNFDEVAEGGVNGTGTYIPGSFFLSGNTLYGTAQQGGSLNYGMVFSLTLPTPPPLTVLRSGANVFLKWPTNSSDYRFTLESTTSLNVPIIWSSDFPAPIVVSGQNSVTNTISGPQKFYRLGL